MRSMIRHDYKLCTRANYLAKNEKKGMAFGLGEEVISAIYLAKEDQETNSFTWWGWLDMYFQCLF